MNVPRPVTYQFEHDTGFLGLETGMCGVTVPPILKFAQRKGHAAVRFRMCDDSLVRISRKADR